MSDYEKSNELLNECVLVIRILNQTKNEKEFLLFTAIFLAFLSKPKTIYLKKELSFMTAETIKWQSPTLTH